MMRRLFVFGLFIFLITVSLTLTTTDPARAQNPCDGVVTPRLSVGNAASVITTYGLSLKNMAAPGAAGATEVELLTYGTVATVLEGPSCGYGYVWWKLSLSNGTVGWAAGSGVVQPSLA